MQKFFFTTLLLILALSSVSFAQIGGAERGSNDRIRITPLALLAFAENSRLEKSTAAAENTVVTKIELFEWKNSTWESHWVFDVSYDKCGRVAEVNIDTVFDGWMFVSEKTLYEYDTENKMIRERQYTWDSLPGNPAGKSESSTDYYLNDRRYPVIPRQPFIALPYSEILPAVAPAFDSVKSFFSIWDAQLQAMVSSETYTHYFSYEGGNSITMWQTIKAADADTQRTNWRCRYSYRFNSDGMVDSVIYLEINSGDSYELTNFLVYSYSGKRLSEIMHSWINHIEYYDLTYTSEGQVSSYIHQYTSSIVTTKTPTNKVAYTYGKVPVVSADTRPFRTSPREGATRLKATAYKDHVSIYAPEGVVIGAVTLYDLRGRQVASLKNNLLNHGSVNLPLTAQESGLLLVRVTSNQGEFHLRVGAAP